MLEFLGVDSPLGSVGLLEEFMPKEKSKYHYLQVIILCRGPTFNSQQPTWQLAATCNFIFPGHTGGIHIGKILRQ